MHAESVDRWRHDHAFGQDRVRPGERSTRLVIVLTAVTMVVEIAGGLAFGSMALLADGLHMASHTAALGVAAFAYWYARRHAHDPAFSFGTGKVNALGAFASAILLGVFALTMAWESAWRFVEPVPILFDQAILVAVVGLAVNGISAVLLHRSGHDHGHGHSQSHDHSHGHGHSHGHHHSHAQDDHGHHHEAHGDGEAAGEDQNLRAAYFHVLADALTSILAIAALLAGKFLGFAWMDPLMGLVGAVLVSVWAWNLSRQSGGVLLDRQAPEALRSAIGMAIEQDGSGDRLSDLHVWSIGPGLYAAELAVVSDRPAPPDHYRAKLPPDRGLAHVTVEVRPCPSHPEVAST
jgi:cation diffusion facilitator family transporter